MSWKRHLACLQYPDTVDSIDITSPYQQSRLIIWLEDRKIREFTVADREGLRANISSAHGLEVWTNAVKEYLYVLCCPYEWESERVECIIWLIQYAVNVEYEDCADDCIDCESEDSIEHSDISDESIVRLGKLVNISPKDSEPLPDFLGRIVKKIRFQLVPLLNNQGSSLGDLEAFLSFPLGFSCDDKTIGDAAKVLKLLYLTDLRELQNDLNALIALGQEYTANPKTNTALGKVGR